VGTSPTVFVGLTVGHGLDYVWRECLEAVAEQEDLDKLVTRIHAVVHNAPEAFGVYRTWAESRSGCSCEEERALPSAVRSGSRGYTNQALTTVMYIQERLRQAFLATDCSHCLFVECDQILRPDNLRVLLSRDTGIVMAATPARASIDNMNACSGAPYNLSLIPVAHFPVGSLTAVTSVGTGCTLVKRPVLEAIGWEDPPALMAKYHNGGDVALCCEATRKLGVKPYVDMMTTAAHVGKRGETLEFYRIEGRTVTTTREQRGR
jgi:hypothetical protein